MTSKDGSKDTAQRKTPGPDSGEATESAAESYEKTEQPGSSLHPTSGDRNTASGSSTQDLGR